MLIKGNTPIIDPSYRNRSREEAKLDEIIRRCFAFDPDDRPSIFEIFYFLSRAVEEFVGDESAATQVLMSVAKVELSESSSDSDSQISKEDDSD